MRTERGSERVGTFPASSSARQPIAADGAYDVGVRVRGGGVGGPAALGGGAERPQIAGALEATTTLRLRAPEATRRSTTMRSVAPNAAAPQSDAGRRRLRHRYLVRLVRTLFAWPLDEEGRRTLRL